MNAFAFNVNARRFALTRAADAAELQVGAVARLLHTQAQRSVFEDVGRRQIGDKERLAVAMRKFARQRRAP